MQIITPSEGKMFPKPGDMLVNNSNDSVWLWVEDTNGNHLIVPIFVPPSMGVQFYFEDEDENADDIRAEFAECMKSDEWRYISQDEYLLKLVRIHDGGAC